MDFSTLCHQSTYLAAEQHQLLRTTGVSSVCLRSDGNSPGVLSSAECLLLLLLLACLLAGTADGTQDSHMPMLGRHSH